MGIGLGQQHWGKVDLKVGAVQGSWDRGKFCLGFGMRAGDLEGKRGCVYRLFRYQSMAMSRPWLTVWVGT